MSKKLKPLEALDELRFSGLAEEYRDKCCDIVETALKQMQKDNEILNIFKNALTIERDIPPELEIKESEKGCSYVFKEAVKVHENRIEEMFKKSLREWVLKNAFPKELKALEIIKEKGLSLLHQSLIISSKNYKEYRQEFQLVKSREFKNEYFYSQQEFDLVREVLL